MTPVSSKNNSLPRIDSGKISGSIRQDIENSQQPPKVGEEYDGALFKDRARHLRRTEGIGQDRIHARLLEEYGDAFKHSIRAVGYWIEGVPKGPGAEYDFSGVQPVDAPYLRRLDLLKRNMFHSQGLTVIEAKTAKELRYFFDNPEGDPVDLFPQLAIIDAYVRTAAAGISNYYLEALLTFQPWDPSGTAHYWRGLEKGFVRLPYIPMLTDFTNRDPRYFLPLAYMVGAYAHLRIPAVSFYSQTEKRIRSSWLNVEHYSGITTPSPNGIEPFRWEDLTVFCNWRELIAASREGDPKSKIRHLRLPEEDGDGDR